jgi:hypothetical protein
MSLKVQQRYFFVFCLLLPVFLSSQQLRFSANDLYIPSNGDLKQLSNEWEYRKQGEKWIKFHFPGSLHQTGQFEMRTYFVADSTAGAESYKLFFHGFYGRCSVFLNKKILGAFTGQGFPAILDVPKELIGFRESNELYMELDSRLNFHDTLPIKSHSEGLPVVRNSVIGSIELVSMKRPCVAGLAIDRINGSQDVQCRLVLQLPALAASGTAGIKSSLLAELCPLNEATVVWHDIFPVQAGQTQDQIITFTIPGNTIESWAPNAPHLYQLKVTLIDQGQSLTLSTTTFGLRTIDFRDFFYINDQQTPLKVIEWVNDLEFVSLPTDSLLKRIDKELVMIKEAGANAVRIYPCPPLSSFLDECDRLGLLALVDMPIINVPSTLLTNEMINAASGSIATAMQNCGNHPCVVAWGAGSGFDAGSAETAEFLKEIQTVVRERDNRPVYAGKRGNTKINNRLPVDFEIIELSPDEIKRIGEDSLMTLHATPVILRLIVPLAWTGRTVESAERDQAFLLSMALKKIASEKNTGIMASPFRDWRGDIPFIQWGPRPDADLFMAGLVDSNGRKRVAYDIVQARFNSSEVPVILPTEYVKDERPLFQVWGSVVLILFLILYRSSRQLRNYLRRIFLFPHGFYFELAENRHVSLPLTIVVGLTAFSSIAVIASSFLYFMRTRQVFDEILSWLFFSPAVKSIVIWLVWNPLVLIIVMTLSFLFCAMIQSILFRIIIFFQRRYVKPLNIFAFVLWVPANLLFTLPLAIIFYRMLNKPELVSTGMVVLAVLLIWLLVRMIRAVTIVLQLSKLKYLVIYGLSFLVLACLLLYYFEHSHSFTAFFPYWWSLWC